MVSGLWVLMFYLVHRLWILKISPRYPWTKGLSKKWSFSTVFGRTYPFGGFWRILTIWSVYTFNILNLILFHLCTKSDIILKLSFFFPFAILKRWPNWSSSQLMSPAQARFVSFCWWAGLAQPS